MKFAESKLALVLLLMTLLPISHAGEQPGREDIRAEYQRVYSALQPYRDNANWLGAAVMLRREYAAQDNARLRRSIAQPLSWVEAILGNTIDAIAVSPGQLGPDASDKVSEIPENVRALPFLQALAQAIGNTAADQQVVMINEAHHVSRHRANTTRLLAPLYDKGFRYLALESMRENGERVAERGFPASGGGSPYLNDPVFGNMIREALRLGYTLVPYDTANSKSVAERETGQARNLAKILESNPKARILVHGGYQHIEESGLMFGSPTMAQEFTRLTGIDPFTISQTKTTWPGPDAEFDPVYRKALSISDIDEPFVLVSNNKPYSVDSDKLDMVIFTPPTRLTDGRPDWLAQLPNRIRVALPVPDSDVPRPWMVEARKSKESADAIPVDRIEVKQGAAREEIVLWLLPGSYDIQWKDMNGKVFHVDSVSPFLPQADG